MSEVQSHDRHLGDAGHVSGPPRHEWTGRQNRHPITGAGSSTKKPRLIGNRRASFGSPAVSTPGGHGPLLSAPP